MSYIQQNEERIKAFHISKLILKIKHEIKLVAYLIIISFKMCSLLQNLRRKREQNQTILAKQQF